MTIKITTPNGGSDSLDFGCAQTPVVATVTGTEVSSGEGKLELKTTTGGTSATKVTVLANGNVGIGTTAPVQKLELNENTTSGGPYLQFENRGIDTTDNSNTYNVGGILAAAYRDAANPANIGSIMIERGIEASGASSSGSIVFGTMSTPTTGIPTERMRITSTGDLKFNSGYGSAATAYGCRAWVNFNGTGTVAIRDSGNVSSITDNGTGIYIINFAVAMVDVNYAIFVDMTPSVSNAGSDTFPINYATASIEVRHFEANVNRDSGAVNVSIFR